MTSILARNLKTLRKLLHLNQQELALALDISRNRIASYETQNIEPKLQLLTQMSQFFKIRIDDLITMEINDSNFTKLQALYSKRLAGNEVVNYSPKKQIALDEEVVETYIKKNRQLSKMLEGLQAYHKLSQEQGRLSYDNQQIMQVLEVLLAVNKDLLKNLLNLHL